ncbi:hypothetical protein DPEC_G00134620 [Dallia pectoralis]|uniref:Uncharacterized protein n=1 Tax=Dallia pectoralis TaxID=75939 RepID=A0ACC2GSD5_DALPE|nr:hypothetical protein DPEC_G00134620 [Dallia pectoralis]
MVELINKDYTADFVNLSTNLRIAGITSMLQQSGGPSDTGPQTSNVDIVRHCLRTYATSTRPGALRPWWDSPGQTLWMRRYTVSMDFVRRFERQCGSQASVGRLEAHPAYQSFCNKWRPTSLLPYGEQHTFCTDPVLSMLYRTVHPSICCQS